MNKSKYMIVLISIFLFQCGGLKVGLDDSTQGTLKCIASNTCDTSSTTSSTSSTDTTSTSTESQTPLGDSQIDNGVAIIDQTTTSARELLGTYKQVGYSDYYYNGDYGSGPCTSQDQTLNFPASVRVYSHTTENILDFESIAHHLLWIATVNEDDTFDFSVTFVDEFKRPDIQTTCTCAIAPAYYNYWNDQIRCSCEDQKGEACGMFYEKLN